jgi:Domain of unknown function (DUF4396)
LPPQWLSALATASVALGFFSTAVTIAMVAARPQKMKIMQLVWPITALYWGPAAPWGLSRYGAPPISQAASRRAQEAEHQGRDSKPFWAAVAVAVTHCGAGCTLGDIFGEWLVYAFGWKLFGRVLYAEFLVDFSLAYLLGIFFQYFTIAPMRGLGLKDGIIAAIKADTASIVAFEIGLFGWMALTKLVLFPQQGIDSWNHWFQMQIGMIIGFFTSYPANWWLLSAGLKEKM